MAGKFRTFLNHEKLRGPLTVGTNGEPFQAIGISNVEIFTLQKSWKIWDKKKYKKKT